jgi:pyruvate ferredoxin oxidoreductase alpha subunit
MTTDGQKVFASGNEAVALGVRLARPHVIAAYPITPQTTVVERLAEMAADGSLRCEYLHVESEHSALSAMMGASAIGARTFTATSSQGLLYMAECLHYASGGRFPIVMMNANRALAFPSRARRHAGAARFAEMPPCIPPAANGFPFINPHKMPLLSIF